MLQASKKLVLICAIAVVLSAMPYSIEASKTAGIIIAANTAQA